LGGYLANQQKVKKMDFDKWFRDWRAENLISDPPIKVAMWQAFQAGYRAAQPQVAADGAVAPIKCAECGDEILPICEACAGDMRRR
jgi:hypothetical protein